MNFSNLNLTTQILSQLPAKLSVATEIQKLAIPEILAGKDVLALAQTGSGKTYAFGLPLLQTIISSDFSDGEIKALVIVPTRELALQVAEAVELVSATVKVTVLCGGVDKAEQVKGLGERPQLVVATPGRLLEFLRQQQLSLQGWSQHRGKNRQTGLP